MSADKKIIISIEGNIGVGKSSFLGLLRQYFGDQADFIYEPVDEWLSIKDENGKDLLQTFYDDKKRWSYTFQNVAYITRMNKLIDAINNSDKKYIIIDRSLSADLKTFTKILIEEGSISKLEMEAYYLWNNFFERNYGDKYTHYIIYLRCKPETAYERVKLRARNAENTIPLDYLKKLHDAHEEWLQPNEDNRVKEACSIDEIKDLLPNLLNVPKVLTLNVDGDFVNTVGMFAELFGSFNNFIKNIK